MQRTLNTVGNERLSRAVLDLFFCLCQAQDAHQKSMHEYAAAVPRSFLHVDSFFSYPGQNVLFARHGNSVTSEDRVVQSGKFCKESNRESRLSSHNHAVCRPLKRRELLAWTNCGLHPCTPICFVFSFSFVARPSVDRTNVNHLCRLSVQCTPKGGSERRSFSRHGNVRTIYSIPLVAIWRDIIANKQKKVPWWQPAAAEDVEQYYVRRDNRTTALLHIPSL